MRALSVWLPTLPTDRVRRRQRTNHPAGQHEQPPLLLVRTHANFQRVARADPLALAQGVRTGLTLAHARAVCPGAEVHEHDPAADARTLRALAARCARRFTPTAGIDPIGLDQSDGQPPPPDGLILDIHGCARLFKGEHRLLEAVARDVRTLGFRARLGVAPTAGAAWALARFGPEPISACAQADLEQALAPLPVRALRLDAATARALNELGIETVAQLAALPRSSLPARFGPAVLENLDAAMGRTLGGGAEPVEAVRAIEAPRSEIQFEGPTTQLEAVELAVRHCLTDLCAQLASEEAGALRVAIELERLDEDARTLRIVTERIELGRPSRGAKHLLGLVWPKLENLHLGCGIESVAAVAERCARVEHRQLGCRDRGHGPWAPSASPTARQAGELIDALAARTGRESVRRPAPIWSHRPEPLERTSSAVDGRGERTDAAVVRAVARLDRPATLLDPPEPCEAVALLPDHPPTLLRWRGRSLKLANGSGPERIGGRWWLARRSVLDRTRDHFRVCAREGDSAAWLWISRAGRPAQWHVHGIWS